MAAWWCPTAANFFDRVSKPVILKAIKEVGGTGFSSRFTSAKKGEVAASAERIFAGTFITEIEVRDRALAWLPGPMTFADASVPVSTEGGEANAAGEACAEPDMQPEAGSDEAVEQDDVGLAA